MAVRADAARALLLRWPARRGLAVRANARFVGTRTQSSGSSGSGDPDAAADGDRGTRAAAARPCHNPLCRNALRPPAIPAHMLAHPTDERIWPEPRESPILAHLPMLYHSPPHRVDTAWTGDARQPLGTALPRNPQVRQERACPHPPPARRGEIAKPQRAIISSPSGGGMSVFGGRVASILPRPRRAQFPVASSRFISAWCLWQSNAIYSVMHGSSCGSCSLGMTEPGIACARVNSGCRSPIPERAGT